MRVRDLDFARLNAYIRRELARRGWTLKELAQRIGYSERALQQLLKAEHHRRWPGCIDAIEDAFDWPCGTARSITEGDDPLGVNPRDPVHDEKIGEIAEDEYWIYDRAEIPLHRRRALVLAYRNLKILDTEPNNDPDNGANGGPENQSHAQAPPNTA